MASSSSSSAAPWRATFLSHVEGMDSPTFVLSTLHPIPPLPGSSDERASQFHYTPRARTVVYRGLWASLLDNPKNTAERNPDVYESDLITITTDERMEKVPELFSTTSTSAAAPQSRPAGPVEAVFWMPDVMTQWRFRGHAVVIGPDIEGDAGSAARAALVARMRSTTSSGKTGEEDDDTHDDATLRRWSWARELTAHFGNLSPVMRGSFRNPPPGTRRDEQPGEGYGLGQKVEDLEDEVARRHFRVVALVPEEVDRVDLSKPDDGRRWNYKYTADQDAWEETELWP